MRLVIQRASEASVTVDGKVVGSIGRGIVVLCGISEHDDEAAADWCAKKLLAIRLFDSDDGSKPWAQSVSQAKLGVLLISQFTLFATLKGNKPDFHHAMGPTTAKPFWEAFVKKVKALHKSGPCEEGVFGAKMDVRLCNDGPVTIQLDSPAPPPAGPQAAPLAPVPVAADRERREMPPAAGPAVAARLQPIRGDGENAFAARTGDALRLSIKLL